MYIMYMGMYGRAFWLMEEYKYSGIYVKCLNFIVYL